ncbi:MAG: bestrophin family ion channel [Acetobacter papayae]|uniref:bestrophin family protein n=1 Tax=Acetobacter papayae TaxID=1076592 RepID=UPI0039E7BCEC
MIVDPRMGLRIISREVRTVLLLMAAWDFVVVVLFQVFHQEWMEQPSLPVPLIGSALALFMGFRSTSAYARWWEGRTLWGSITNNCRSFGRQAGTLLGDRHDLMYAIAAYPHALRMALGKLDASEDINRLLPASMREAIVGYRNQPNAILYQIGLGVAEEVRKKNIDGAVHGQIDRILSDLANAQGGLERIRNTPLPMQFSVLPRVLVNIFCIVLPLSMVQTLEWITPLGSSLVGCLFLVLDKSASDLQEPFANTLHALPMATMARTIEIDVLQPTGDSTAPALQTVNGVQS